MPDHYAVVGHPIAHSLSPRIHSHFAESTGQDLTYEAIDVAEGGLEAFLNGDVGQSLAGVNVTMPHKQDAARLSFASPAARLAGAVNTLIRDGDRWRGENTDGPGLVADLTRSGYQIQGMHLLILGAGGATRGILPTLLEQRPERVVLVNRTRARAEELARLFDHRIGIDPDGQFDAVIHTSAAGHHGRAPEFDPRWVTRECWAYDLNYGQAAGPFLERVLGLGIRRVKSGIGMLIEQAAASFALWRGVMPSTELLHRELQDL